VPARNVNRSLLLRECPGLMVQHELGTVEQAQKTRPRPASRTSPVAPPWSMLLREPSGLRLRRHPRQHQPIHGFHLSRTSASSAQPAVQRLLRLLLALMRSARNLPFIIVSACRIEVCVSLRLSCEETGRKTLAAATAGRTVVELGAGDRVVVVSHLRHASKNCSGVMPRTGMLANNCTLSLFSHSWPHWGALIRPLNTIERIKNSG